MFLHKTKLEGKMRWEILLGSAGIDEQPIEMIGKGWKAFVLELTHRG